MIENRHLSSPGPIRDTDFLAVIHGGISMAGTEVQQSWQQTIAEWQASGLSGAAFCKQHSLAYHRFMYWRRKRSVNAEQEPGAERGPGFARVMSLPPATPSLDGLTVSLPGEVSIPALHAGNVALLGAILKQL